MKVKKRVLQQRIRRTFRIRNRVRRSAGGRLRLSVFRSNRHMYAQIIDDDEGQTVCAASTVEKGLFGPGQYAGNKNAAERVGTLIAQRAAKQGIEQVVFDRGGCRFHGRVAALAEAARKGGLDF